MMFVHSSSAARFDLRSRRRGGVAAARIVATAGSDTQDIYLGLDNEALGICHVRWQRTLQHPGNVDNVLVPRDRPARL